MLEPDPRLEGPDEHITLRRAGEIAGLSPSTLLVQARAGKLRAVKPAYKYLTTRRWLHAYLTEATARDRGNRKPLPAGYEPPAAW